VARPRLHHPLQASAVCVAGKKLVYVDKAKVQSLSGNLPSYRHTWLYDSRLPRAVWYLPHRYPAGSTYTTRVGEPVVVKLASGEPFQAENKARNTTRQSDLIPTFQTPIAPDACCCHRISPAILIPVSIQDQFHYRSWTSLSISAGSACNGHISYTTRGNHRHTVRYL
jgi:hypothetical protein